MANSNSQILDDDGRKRHLDSLFADEPFLSPTMKARSMHDKLRAMRSSEMDGGGRVSSGPLVPDWLRPAATREDATSARAERPSAGSAGISFAEATSRLRQPAPQAHGETRGSDPISRFRAEVLSQWVREVRPRETNRIDTEDRPDSTGHSDIGRAIKQIFGSKDLG